MVFRTKEEGKINQFNAFIKCALLTFFPPHNLSLLNLMFMGPCIVIIFWYNAVDAVVLCS